MFLLQKVFHVSNGHDNCFQCCITALHRCHYSAFYCRAPFLTATRVFATGVRDHLTVNRNSTSFAFLDTQMRYERVHRILSATAYPTVSAMLTFRAPDSWQFKKARKEISCALDASTARKFNIGGVRCGMFDCFYSCTHHLISAFL